MGFFADLRNRRIEDKRAKQIDKMASALNALNEEEFINNLKVYNEKFGEFNNKNIDIITRSMGKNMSAHEFARFSVNDAERLAIIKKAGLCAPDRWYAKGEIAKKYAKAYDLHVEDNVLGEALHQAVNGKTQLFDLYMETNGKLNNESRTDYYDEKASYYVINHFNAAVASERKDGKEENIKNICDAFEHVTSVMLENGVDFSDALSNKNKDEFGREVQPEIRKFMNENTKQEKPCRAKSLENAKENNEEF